MSKLEIGVPLLLLAALAGPSPLHGQQGTTYQPTVTREYENSPTSSYSSTYQSNAGLTPASGSSGSSSASAGNRSSKPSAGAHRPSDSTIAGVCGHASVGSSVAKACGAGLSHPAHTRTSAVLTTYAAPPPAAAAAGDDSLLGFGSSSGDSSDSGSSSFSSGSGSSFGSSAARPTARSSGSTHSQLGRPHVPGLRYRIAPGGASHHYGPPTHQH